MEIPLLHFFGRDFYDGPGDIVYIPWYDPVINLLRDRAQSTLSHTKYEEICRSIGED
jgi:hypothetical protein